MQYAMTAATILVTILAFWIAHQADSLKHELNIVKEQNQVFIDALKTGHLPESITLYTNIGKQTVTSVNWSHKPIKLDIVTK